MPNSKQRREAERRRLQRRIERERAALARRRQRVQIVAAISAVVVVIAIVVVALVVTGGGDEDTGNTAAGTTTCTYTATGNAAKQVIPPSGDKVPSTGTDTAQITTNQGVINATLDRENAPCAVNSFISLAGQDYFNGTTCHRLTSGGLSVLQCGDPLGNGSGGPGYTFNDELKGTEKYTRGTLAMANSGANTNGSQFFVVYGDSALSADYTVFGTIDDASLAVVDAIAAGGVVGGGTDGTPVNTTTIQTVTIGSEVAKSASVASTASEASASAASKSAASNGN